MGSLPNKTRTQKRELDILMDQVKPNSLTPEQLSKLLTLAGRKPVSVEDVRKRIAEGAPSNADGTVNLLHFAAWLASKDAEQGR